MLTTRSVVSIISATVMFLGAGSVAGQNFPDKSVRFVTSGVGAASDILARLLAKELTDFWGKPVVVDNRSSGVIPMEIVAKATPDGYSLLVVGNSLWVVPLLDKVSYDPVKDFSPVTMASTSPAVLVVNPQVPVKSVKELIDLAKAKPGQLNYAAGASGSSNHLATELFKSMAGVNIVRIQYKSVVQNVTAVIAGEVQMIISSTVSLGPQIAAGKVRALAVTSAKPSPLAPGLPTISESGVPGYQAEQTLNVFAPPKTPANIIDLLNREIVRVVRRPDVKEKLFNTGGESVGSTPQFLATTMKSEMVRMNKVIKDTGIRSE